MNSQFVYTEWYGLFNDACCQSISVDVRTKNTKYIISTTMSKMSFSKNAVMSTSSITLCDSMNVSKLRY